MQRITINHATRATGGVGYPSKMPGTSYGIPTRHCGVGGKLKNVLGSVCEGCYADETKSRGRYGAASVKMAQDARFASLERDDWIPAMAHLLNTRHGLLGNAPYFKVSDPGWHRWHDSGDIQSESHLDHINAVALLTPQIRHWLPTREIAIVARWLKSRFGCSLEDMNQHIAPNLCIRISATMVDGAPTHRAPNTSTVVRETTPAESDRCTAPDTGGKCASCRKCWDKSHANTAYHVH